MIARRAKLVCTIGPATADRVDELVAVGMDVARVNFSHGTDTSRERAAREVHAAAARAGRPIALLADLAGPKVRLGELEGPEIALEPGRAFTLRADGPPGDRQGAPVPHDGLAGNLRAGDRVLLADGAVELRVVGADGDDVRTEVVRGGTIRPHAGVNVPAERLGGSGLTAQDREDAPRAAELGAHYVAQSFVRRASDVADLGALLGPDGPSIVAKIETRPAIDDFDAICEAADAIMVARGDLGVEVPYEEVPILQKQLVRRALDRGVTVIVATQMLESMIVSPRPTRAEASDVANAIFDGADAILLSGETAIGAHPILAAEAAARIIDLCEERGIAYLAPGAPPRSDTDADALAYAAVALAKADRDVDAIACYTRSGHTARILAALRPRVPILAYSPDPLVVARLALVHGVAPRPCIRPADHEGRLRLMAGLLAEDDTLPAESAVVLVASTAGPGPGPNLLEVRRVP